MEAARQTTPEQQAALTALHQWLAQYLMIARIALQDKPRLLKSLLPRRRGGQPPAQRGATQKTTTRTAKKRA